MTLQKYSSTPIEVFQLEYEFVDGDGEICLEDLLLDRRVSGEEALKWATIHASMNGYQFDITSVELYRLEVSGLRSEINFAGTETHILGRDEIK